MGGRVDLPGVIKMETSRKRIPKTKRERFFTDTPRRICNLGGIGC